jgi:hypothetical protein
MDEVVVDAKLFQSVTKMLRQHCEIDGSEYAKELRDRFAALRPAQGTREGLEDLREGAETHVQTMLGWKAAPLEDGDETQQRYFNVEGTDTWVADGEASEFETNAYHFLIDAHVRIQQLEQQTFAAVLASSVEPQPLKPCTFCKIDRCDCPCETCRNKRGAEQPQPLSPKLTETMKKVMTFMLEHTFIQKGSELDTERLQLVQEMNDRYLELASASQPSPQRACEHKNQSGWSGGIDCDDCKRPLMRVIEGKLTWLFASRRDEGGAK